MEDEEIIKHTSKLHEYRFKNGSIWMLWCPACERPHQYVVAPADSTEFKVRWDFNGDVHNPTFSPSLRHLSDPKCHINIHNGKIIFHGDCPKMAGQIVDMADIPERPFSWMKEITKKSE